MAVTLGLPVLLFILLASVIFFKTTRWTTTIDVGEGAKLTYSLQDGWEMRQTIAVSGGGIFDRGMYLTEDVFKTTHNAGGPLFSNMDKTVYYLGLQRGVYRISIPARTVEEFCPVPEDQPLTYVGQFTIIGFDRTMHMEGVQFTPADQAQPMRAGVEPTRDALKCKLP